MQSLTRNGTSRRTLDGSRALSTQLAHMSPLRREGASPHFTDEQTEAQRRQCTGAEGPELLVGSPHCLSSKHRFHQEPGNAACGTPSVSFCFSFCLQQSCSARLRWRLGHPHTQRAGEEGWGLLVTFLCGSGLGSRMTGCAELRSQACLDLGLAPAGPWALLQQTQPVCTCPGGGRGLGS